VRRCLGRQRQTGHEMHNSDSGKLAAYRASSRFWIYGLVLVGGLLRFDGVGEKSLWVDEAKSINLSRDSTRLLEYCRRQNRPPLRPLLLCRLQRYTPTETYVRLPSAIFGALCAPMLFLMARGIFGLRVAATAALLLAFSPWQIFHAQDARMYSVFLFLVIASLHLLFRALKTEKMWQWALLGLLWAASAYLTYLGLWPACFMFLFLLALIAGRARLQVSGRPQRLRPLVKGTAFCLLFAMAAYAPWVYNMRHMLERYDLGKVEPSTTVKNPSPTESETPPQPEWGHPFATQYDLDYFKGFIGKLSCRNGPAAAALTFFFLLGLGFCFRARRDVFLLTLIWAVAPWICLAASSASWFFPPRYLIYYVPLYLILASLGLVRSMQWLFGRVNVLARISAPKRRAALVSWSFVAALLVCFSVDIRDYQGREKQDWRGAVAYLAANNAPGDIIVTGQAWTEQAVHFYLRQIDHKATLIMYCYNPDELRKVLSEQPRISYVNWGSLPKPIQDIIDQRLELKAVFPGMLGEVKVYGKSW
jgi:hypothetical protein